MRFVRRLLVSGAVLICIAAPSGRSVAAVGRRTLRAASEAFEKEISAELMRLDPQAAGLFAQAGEARERGDHAAAADLYRRVFEKVPAFVHALRRRAYEEAALGRHDVAVSLSRRAVELDHSATNVAALALVLVLREDQGAAPPKPEELDEGYRLASEASALDPNDPFAQLPLCQAAMLKREFLVLGRCVANLKGVAPDDPATHYYDAIFHATAGRIAEAASALERSHELGLPDEEYARLSAMFVESRPIGSRLIGAAKVLGAAWVSCLLLLLAAGWILSLAALRAAGRVPSDKGGRARGVDSLLRRLYAVVLWLCCAFYYLSLPLLVGVVAAVGGGIVYVFLSVGRIPIKLLVVVVVLTVATLWAILKSLFIRRVEAAPGLLLESQHAPKLREVLKEVAARVETRPVDSVYLTPGTEVAVMERGGLWRQLAGTRERCLILGIGVLEGMRLGPLKAVLAHEYGHFSNRDTAGGGFALAVRRSLISMATGLAQGGAATWYNPAWLFVNGFYRVFLRISQGASRLQEVLADRWAASLYGAAAFQQGLRHVIDRSIRFNAHVSQMLKEVIESKAALQNLYASEPARRPSEDEIGKALDEALSAEPSPYDSHPSPSDRFAWVQRVPAAGAIISADDDRPAWDLFENRPAIEQWLTEVVRENVARRYNVSIPAASPAAG